MYRDAGVIVPATEFPVNLESHHLPPIVVPDGYSLRARKPIMSFYAPDGAKPSQGRGFARRYLVSALALIAVVVAGISVSAYTMPIASRERAFRLSAIFLVGGFVAITGIPQYVRGKARIQALLWCTPLVLPILYPITIAIGRLRLAVYLQSFGLNLSDVAPGTSTILSAALSPVGIAAFLSLVVVGIFGWIRYFVHRDWGLGVLMLIACIVAYFVASVQWAMQSGNSEGVRTVAAVRAGNNFPELYGFAPDLACVSPLKASIATRGATLTTNRPVYVFSSPQSNVVALWDSRSGQPTWVYASDVRILDVRSTHVQCPSG